MTAAGTRASVLGFVLQLRAGASADVPGAHVPARDDGNPDAYADHPGRALEPPAGWSILSW